MLLVEVEIAVVVGNVTVNDVKVELVLVEAIVTSPVTLLNVNVNVPFWPRTVDKVIVVLVRLVVRKIVVVGKIVVTVVVIAEGIGVVPRTEGTATANSMNVSKYCFRVGNV